MRSFTLSLLVLTVLVRGASAIGVADLAWNGCTGPTDRAVVTGDAPELYVSVLGMANASIGYTVKLRLSTPGAPGSYPDAWRFDATGCEPFGAFQAGQDAPPAIAATCPPMHGTVASSFSKTFTYDGTTGVASIVLQCGYLGQFGAGNQNVNASQRYHLGIVRFVMTNGVNGPASVPQVSCGGLEKPVCITLTAAQWTSPAGATSDWTVGNASITANDPADVSQCPGLGPTPAQRSTWGLIKSQYRL